MKATIPMMQPAVKAVALGLALTVLSLLHRGGMDWIYRGFPFFFVSVYQSDLVTSYQDPPIIWRFLGCRPLIADWLIWTGIACVCLRLVKGTASALIGVAAIQCAIGFLQWWNWGDYFGWANWLIVTFTVSIYLLLGIHARRSQLAAAFIGAGLYAPLVALQAYQSVDQLISDLILQIPIAVLLLLAVLFALRRKGKGATSERDGNCRCPSQRCERV
jgi:hypothetical protein